MRTGEITPNEASTTSLKSSGMYALGVAIGAGLAISWEAVVTNLSNLYDSNDDTPEVQDPTPEEPQPDTMDKPHKNSKDSEEPAQTYTIEDQDGKPYHGVGDTDGKRTEQSKKEQAKKNPGKTFTTKDQTNHPNRREAYKDEDKRIQESGGVKSDENYNNRNSPGRKINEEEGN